MPAKKNDIDTVDGLTVMVPEKEVADEPRVRIMLPLLEDQGSGVKVDQYEHVSISNANGDKYIRVKRGEPVDVTVPVFMLLKQKYPKL